MTLGMIYKQASEDTFRDAAKRKLDFVEFCVNGPDDHEAFLNKVPMIRKWSEQYSVGVGSIGRWKAEILDSDGNINPAELDLAFRLSDAAEALGSPNYICGCNYCEKISFYANCTKAIEFFSAVLEHCKSYKLKVSTYNCTKMNFVNTPEVWKIIHGHLPELGIKYDPSHAVYGGRDYLEEARDWGDRFQHVHLKGSLMVGGQRVDDPPAGLDRTDWKTFLSILYAKGYNRGLSIEPHSPVWQGQLGEQGIDYTISYFRPLIMNP